MIYLDNHATTRCDPDVVAAMIPYFLSDYGNPHSVEHAMGMAADEAVEFARGEVADLIGAEPQEIIFTSGATEANNLALYGIARAAPDRSRFRLITLATEHPSVLEPLGDLEDEEYDLVTLPVRRNGLVDLAMLREALTVPTLLVSVMAVNNEIGVIQDLAAIAKLAHEAGAVFHCDGAQALGRMAIDVRATGIDLMSLSAHKIYGPKGIGALFVRHRPRIRLRPMMSGGGQERGLRPGTVAAPLVVGFGAACAIARRQMATEQPRVLALRSRLLAGLRAHFPTVIVNGDEASRVAGNLNVTLRGLPARELMRLAPELCVSTGSACSTGEAQTSHVQRAIGVSDADAACTLRIGLGRFTSQAECDAAVKALAVAAQEIEAMACPK